MVLPLSSSTAIGTPLGEIQPTVGPRAVVDVVGTSTDDDPSAMVLVVRVVDGCEPSRLPVPAEHALTSKDTVMNTTTLDATPRQLGPILGSMSIGHLLRSPVVLRAMAAILAAIAALAFPDLITEFVFLLLGVVAIVVGSIELYGWWRSKHLPDLLTGAGLILFGLLMLFGGQQTDRFLEVGLAGVLAWRGVVNLSSAIAMRRSTDADPFWPTTRGLLLVLLALTLVVIPEVFLQGVLVVVSISWIVGGAIVIVNTIGESEETPVPNDVLSVIRDKSMPAKLQKQVSDAIFEGLDSHDGGVAFAALMAFATAIATFGIKADSTAVVIGAMLIAPLMTPIMALSASILMGWPHRLWKAGRRVVLGVIIGVAGSFLMSLISPDFVAITSNSQVLSRTAPTVLDLLIALAAGAAGGYAVTHPRVGNSLPGVAIAVALAPPLAVVGYSLEEGAFAFSAGASLLFLTNLVGIMVAAGLTYVVSGYSPWSRLERADDQTRRSMALVGIALLMVAIPLGIIGEGIVHQTTARTDTTRLVDDWLGEDSAYELVRVNVTGDDVSVFLTGSGEFASDVEDLATDLSTTLATDITLYLDVTPREETTVRVEDGQVSSEP